jgi:hypothetical protein
MAKGRVGVLEAHEPPKSVAPQTCCGRAIAERLVNSCEARWIGKRLIQMVRAKAADAIKWAKAARDAAKKMSEEAVTAMSYDGGPLGRGLLIPFSKVRNYGDLLHYAMPLAGDLGMRRYGLFTQKDEDGIPQLRSRIIGVSSRSLFSEQLLSPVSVRVRA